MSDDTTITITFTPPTSSLPAGSWSYDPPKPTVTIPSGGSDGIVTYVLDQTTIDNGWAFDSIAIGTVDPSPGPSGSVSGLLDITAETPTGVPQYAFDNYVTFEVSQWFSDDTVVSLWITNGNPNPAIHLAVLITLKYYNSPTGTYIKRTSRDPQIVLSGPST